VIDLSVPNSLDRGRVDTSSGATEERDCLDPTRSPHLLSKTLLTHHYVTHTTIKTHTHTHTHTHSVPVESEMQITYCECLRECETAGSTALRRQLDPSSVSTISAPPDGG